MPSASQAPGRWPELILSGRPFLGSGTFANQVNLECLVRFSKPENSAGVLTAAARRGVTAITPMNDLTLLQALDLARATCGLQVYPVIPNAVGYVRDATDYGMVGAGIRHLRRLGLADLIGIGLRGVTRIRGALARDFRTILPILIDVEMAAFRAFRPPLVLLHGQVTDIAVALGNREALRIFADVVRRRFGAEPGVVTSNFGPLMRALTEWKVDIGVVVAPFNSKGFLMKPSREVCETLLRATDRYVIADRVGSDGVESLASGFDYLRRVGLHSAIVEIADAEGIDAVLASNGQPRPAGGSAATGVPA
jgi:hypothetical protein